MLASRMHSVILVVNCGSSSVKIATIRPDGGRVDSLSVDGVGAAPTLTVDGERRPVEAPDLGAAVRVALDALERHGAVLGQVVAVGHRIVHGGDRCRAPLWIDDEALQAIEALSRYAPLHNPPAVTALRAARERLPAVPHVAVFDTAFHATLPRRAREYAIDAGVRQQLGLRRFGFHGTSHDYVTSLAATSLGADRRDLRMVSAHLGAGASITAVEYGRSVDTSMGLTPLEGLVMATRSGDVDPGLILTLLREGYTADQVDQLLNRASGLLGLTGSADLRVVEERAQAGDDACQMAIQIYAYRVRKYIGAYAAAMGGLDVIVFTGGVGQNSATMRRRIVERLDFIGVSVDDDRNRDGRATAERPVVNISSDGARCPVLVIATDEEAAIAGAVRALMTAQRPRETAPIPVAVSARHVHLTRDSVEALFGPGHVLTVAHPISQPGQYAAVETVTLVGPTGRIDNVRVVGPERGADQVELSRTDEFRLGVDAPVRESGDLTGTPGLRLEGPAGTVTLPRGVICALRHIHMTPADAERYGVTDGEDVDVHISSEAGRSLTFGDVRIRVSAGAALEMHIDTDEANAAGLHGPAGGLLEPVAHRASVQVRG